MIAELMTWSEALLAFVVITTLIILGIYLIAKGFEEP